LRTIEFGFDNQEVASTIKTPQIARISFVSNDGREDPIDAVLPADEAGPYPQQQGCGFFTGEEVTAKPISPSDRHVATRRRSVGSVTH
jgi:hypothetical protein